MKPSLTNNVLIDFFIHCISQAMKASFSFVLLESTLDLQQTHFPHLFPVTLNSKIHCFNQKVQNNKAFFDTIDNITLASALCCVECEHSPTWLPFHFSTEPLVPPFPGLPKSFYAWPQCFIMYRLN